MKDLINNSRLPGTMLDVFVKLPILYNAYEEFKNKPDSSSMNDLVLWAENLEKSIDIFKQTMALAIEEISKDVETNCIIAHEDNNGIRI